MRALLIVGWIFVTSAFGGDTPTVAVGGNGRLVYGRDELGNQIPDFSDCGYAGAAREIPEVAIQTVVTSADGDDGPRIQAAIDQVAELSLDANGLRGAVLLAAGRFDIGGQLHISTSGIVLRGSGAGPNGTTLVATGEDRRALLHIDGIDNRRSRGNATIEVVDDYVPVGSRTLRLNSTRGLEVGDRIVVTRPSPVEWIQSLGADAFGVGWKPGTRDIRWDRTIVKIDGDTITLDAPITTAIETRFGGATVEAYDWPGRISNVGVEDLKLQSDYTAANPHDEEDAWFGITMENVENAWVRRVEFRHFAGGAVALWDTTKHVTVEDCISVEPVSELGGYRRHTFFTQGQLSLFLRCWSEGGRHDFAVGHCAAGPNAFVNCYAAQTHGGSGPIESWASGVLYDNVRIDGGSLDLKNRWSFPSGAGWSAANCVLWQCQAATMHVSRPPAANNWAIGVWAEFAGDGSFAGRSDFVRPFSLYQAQARERHPQRDMRKLGLGLVDPIGSTNPTLEEAASFTVQSAEPPRRLIDDIRERFESASPGRAESQPASPPTEYDAPSTTKKAGSAHEEDAAQRLALQNGWLVVGNRLKTGGVQHQGFWRGTIRPGEVRQFGPAITRFVPGRVGIGFTDDLATLADEMVAADAAVFDHHYGLWYDRRRDDHTMVRRQDGNVVPPFYEQPFARTGQGKAWDGLSKYDLTQFNPWYWRRLSDFARLCDDRGLVLVHQNYFQHNILEAGAHWADSPWRPANNINQTGLPEPPPYIGDKRIFIAAQFYDVSNDSNDRLRELHRGYIHKCLENFADCSNVIQMTSAEYSGPLEFVQFWLDTIIEWKMETGRDVLVGLSAPKNVQDAILADPARAPHVDVIDIRYWCYTKGGELYAPEGGKNLAPRQHLRKTRQKPGGAPAIVKAVREYRERFSDKSVTYYADMHCPSTRDGWAVLIGGGSLPNVKLPDDLSHVIPTMLPADHLVSGKSAWCLTSERGDCLIYTDDIGQLLRAELPDRAAEYRGRWIDAANGNVLSTFQLAAGGLLEVSAKAKVLWLERVATE